MDPISRALSPEVAYVRVKAVLFLIKLDKGVRVEPMMKSNKLYAQIQEKFPLLPFDSCVRNNNSGGPGWLSL